jgi:dynein intermediate chain 1
VGFICLFSLKNPSFPEYICRAPCGVLCLDISAAYPHLIVAGLYDGNVAVYNLCGEEASNTVIHPTHISNAHTGKHREPVWQVQLADDNLDGFQNFYSCSSDGRVTNWILVKAALCHSDQLLLAFQSPLQNIKSADPEKLRDGARAIAFNPEDPDIFLVGTEEGNIHLATVTFASKYLASYTGHTAPVNSLAWNPFVPDIFLSCAAESLVLIWHREIAGPVLRHCLDGMVGQVAWAPYSSTVFAAVTTDCKVVVFDLHVHKYRAICQQKIISVNDGVLNNLSFNPVDPVMIVGDSQGQVHCLKLSPNLRKKTVVVEKAQEEKPHPGQDEEDRRRLKMLEVTKLRKILSQIIPKGAVREDTQDY